ncbi:hypothetical protein Pth03_81650 [Planotetraspora thailandica]|uniref:F5/8 type C domain-containing protein n=1 Tax=Planotetraspora thailandica TaxID=487172 RepID=A0A8J4DFY4_9ACTN|nr:discoidin domain-containing protein [Planotetraspora thailandica]GII59776.1 hypothetical protein Pth03_81650 [Planotetraspora thailandica]
MLNSRIPPLLRMASVVVALGAAVTLSPTASSAAAATSFYVAPDGHGHACSARVPCALETAQAKVRHRTEHMTGDIVVTIEDGTYRLGKTLDFDAARGDSGVDGHSVIYQAAPGAHPVLSGGTRITGWTQGPGGAWQASVPAGFDTRQLYVDGVRANRASGPNPTGFTRTATGYTTTTGVLSTYKNITDVEFVYGVAWSQMRCQIASVQGATVTMKQPCFDNSTRKQYGANADLPNYVENAKELLNDPGEWYLDKPAHTVYYIPRAGEDMAQADIEAPRLQTIITGHGTEAEPLRGLTLRGLTVEYGTWLEPNSDDGFSEVQANMRLTGDKAWDRQGSCDRFDTANPGTCPYGNWTTTPGNVVFTWTDGLTLERDTFQHLGAAGVELGRGTHHAAVRGNVFTDISGNGLEIGNGTDADPGDVAVIPADNVISDNWVHNIATEYTGGVGIFQGYARNSTIEHNQVNDVPYSGISSNWGWGRTSTKTTGNVIADNLIFDYLQIRADGGGIYVLGQEGSSMETGLTIKGNVIRGAIGGGHAIYTDGGSQYVTVSGNAMYGNHIPSYGGCNERQGTPYGDLLFSGNYWENPTGDWPCGDPSNLTVTGNTQVNENGDGVPASVLAGAGIEPAYADISAAPAGVAAINVAAGKPAKAIFLNGGTAGLQPESKLEYATDGDPSTYVQASGQFRWQLEVDLGQVHTLGYVTVGMPQKHFATDFHVDTSQDGVTFTTAATVHDSGWGRVPVQFGTPVTARYVRVVADKPDDWGQRGDQMAIDEFGAFEAPAADFARGRGAAALFTDKTVAKMQPGSTAAYAVDGDPATFAQASDRYRWILQVDLQQVRSLETIAVVQPSRAYATAFHVDVSVDGSTYWTVAHRTDVSYGVTGVGLDSPTKARFIRIVADRPNDGGQTGGQMAVSELKAFGAG